MNPGKIVRPTRMDDASAVPLSARASTLRAATRRSTGRRGTCRTIRSTGALSRPAAAAIRARGFAKAVEMCNNNGHCRKFDAGTMCPSYRVTRDEKHLTRGRANTLRLALSGQLGAGRARVDAVREALDLCVELQGLPPRVPDRRRHGEDEDRVPVPMAARARAAAARPADRAPAALGAARRRASPGLLNLRDRVPGAGAADRAAGSALSARRTLPRWRRDTFLRATRAATRSCGRRRRRAVRRHVHQLFRARERARGAAGAARRRLSRCRRRADVPRTASRPLCCGRTFLAARPGRRGAARSAAR